MHIRKYINSLPVDNVLNIIIMADMCAVAMQAGKLKNYTYVATLFHDLYYLV